MQNDTAKYCCIYVLNTFHLPGIGDAILQIVSVWLNTMKVVMKVVTITNTEAK